MKITITGKELKATEAIKDYVEKKLTRIEKYFGDEAIDVTVTIKKENAAAEKNMVVCVPSVMIKTFADTAKKLVATGAENCYFAEKGAYTGEISAKMIAELISNIYDEQGNCTEKHKYDAYGAEVERSIYEFETRLS